MVEAKKVKIGPIACYFEAFELIKENYWFFWSVVFLGMMIAGAVPLFLQGPMFCGMILVVMTHQRGEPVEFGMLFKGFDYFMPSLIGALMTMVATMIVCVPIIVFSVASMFFGLFSIQNDNTALAIAGFSGYGIGLTFNGIVQSMLTTLMWFTCGLIIDRKMEGMEAFNMALSAVWKNKVELFLHSIVGTLLILACSLLCIFPAFLIMPVFFLAEYIAYVKVFGISQSKPRIVEDVTVVR